MNNCYIHTLSKYVRYTYLITMIIVCIIVTGVMIFAIAPLIGINIMIIYASLIMYIRLVSYVIRIVVKSLIEECSYG